MIIKKLKHPYKKNEIHQESIVLILGFFDGIHRGHQAVIKKGVEIARKNNLKAVVMTFNRHPALVYRTYDPVKHAYLTLSKRKEELIARLGVDILYEVAFTSKLGSLSPQEFVDQYIIDWHAKYVVAGYDYTYGKQAVANMDTLPELSKGKFETVVVNQQQAKQMKISSTRIRQAISNGCMKEANNLLGYYYQTNGFVVHGEARGRDLGYPTANIQIDPSLYLPKIGVYAVTIEVDGKNYGGMASIGYNVTFGQRNYYTIEVNIFDFNQEIYGEDVVVRWLEYMRDEIKFDQVSTLVEQLDADARQARQILAQLKENYMY